MKAPAVAALLFALTACTASPALSRRDVEAAFAEQRFDLRAADERFVSDEGTILVPASGEPFLVVVYGDDAAAEDALDVLESQRTRDSFDARARNVLVTSDEPLAVNVQTRIRAALEALD